MQAGTGSSSTVWGWLNPQGQGVCGSGSRCRVGRPVALLARDRPEVESVGWGIIRRRGVAVDWSSVFAGLGGRRVGADVWICPAVLVR